MNRAELIGNVGSITINDVNSVKVANISLATNERGFKTKDGKEVPERTEWHNIVLWRGLAEIAEKYITKGTKLFVEGKLQTRDYEKDGIKFRATSIIATNIELLGSKPQSEAPVDAPEPVPFTEQDIPAEGENGLPF